jgi:hypothetical protein
LICSQIESEQIEEKDMPISTARLVPGPKGVLAREYGHQSLPLEVLQSAAGFYLGTQQDGMPYSRESAEYWRTSAEAERALAVGEDAWTQRDHP